ncbi:MAG: hypothetical protein HY929_03690 [Euryarchaeota archaeon]|nr:hypothetical protein [Euryarchaeota archaeon]
MRKVKAEIKAELPIKTREKQTKQEDVLEDEFDELLLRMFP